MSEPRTWGTADLVVVAMARLLRDGEVVFHGVNSILPMVAVALARRLHAPRLRAINIAGGIDPTPRFLPRSTTDPELARGSGALLSNEDFYDLCMRGGVDTAFLGAAQVDALGRTNVSSIGPPDRPKVRLPGGGGAPIIMATAGRTIVWRTEHSRRSFVERLDFVTAAGHVDRVVTPSASSAASRAASRWSPSTQPSPPPRSSNRPASPSPSQQPGPPRHPQLPPSSPRSPKSTPSRCAAWSSRSRLAPS